MTDATGTPHSIIDRVADRLGVDVETLPQREPGAAGRRLRVIAALHALADHLAAHPDVPTPTYVTAGCRLETREELAAVAADLGSKVYADGYQTHLEIATAAGRDLCTTIILSAARPDRPL
jgi:hypothetical protein